MVDFLAICAHPDDLEVCASGIFIKAKNEGKKTGLIVLTRGEAGGYASMNTRIVEANAGAAILKLDYYKQLDFPDAGLRFCDEVIEALIPLVRECSPRIIFTLHPDDYHPDHKAVSQIVDAVSFTAGLNKYSTDGSDWHYENLFHFSADTRTNRRRPDILVDISDVMDTKLSACDAHASQKVTQYALRLSEDLGMTAGVEYAEGLYLRQPLTISQAGTLLK